MVVAEKRDKTLCVLITGASRGIGLELVKQYLLRVGRGNYGRGGHVIACARDPDKSMDLLRCFTVDYVSYELVPLDVTDPGSFGDLHEHLQDLDRIKEAVDATLEPLKASRRARLSLWDGLEPVLDD